MKNFECEDGVALDVTSVIQDINQRANTLEMPPINSIVMFNGISSEIPNNWVLCDGTNGTPDLRNMFIQGSNTDADNGMIGGFIDKVLGIHSHTGTVLTDNNGEHEHLLEDCTRNGGHKHTGSLLSGGSHSHNSIDTTYTPLWIDSTAKVTDCFNGYYGPYTIYNAEAPISVNGGEHSHSLILDATGIHTHTVTLTESGNHTHTFTISTDGEDGAGKNLPPYYKLAFIMRIS